MDEKLSLDQLVVLRRLSQTLADSLAARVRRYVATLAPLLRPKTMLGDLLSGGDREPVRGAEKAFKELRALYGAVAPAGPFFLAPDLEPPIEVSSTSVEVSPLQYTHVIRSGDAEKKVLVTAPLKWALTYSGYSIPRLRELVAGRDRSQVELKEALLQYLVLHLATSEERGLSPLFAALRFPVVAQRFPEFGKLPITVITAPASTRLPSDDVVLESTEISGADEFEEVVDVPALLRLTDPFQEKLARLVAEKSPDLSR